MPNPKTSTTIDITSLKVAGEGASKYITEITGNGGINVHDATSNSNYVAITSDGMEIYRGTDTATKVAEFKSYITLGYRAVGSPVYATSLIPGDASAVIGQGGVAQGNYSISTGYGTEAVGNYSFASGANTYAIGQGSFTEGESTKATGIPSHAGGNGSIASGNYSFAYGDHVIASSTYQTVFGKYNKEVSDALFIIGNGTDASTTGRSNLFVLKDNDITIGNESDRHLKINSNGLLFYRNSSSFPMKMLGGYESGYLAIEDNNYDNYTGNNTVYTNRLLFDRNNIVTTLMTGYRSGTTIKEGQVDISYNKAGLYLTENTTVSAIILQKDEVTNQHTVMLTTPITYVGNDKLTFYNSSDGTSHKAVSIDTNGRLYTQNDSTNYVGILKPGTKRSDWTGDNYSIPKASSRYIMYITLSPGSWIVNGTVRFASNSTGVRRVGLSTSNSAGTDPLDCQIPAGSGAIQLRTVRLFELTAQTTYYLHAYQSSNGALNVTFAGLHAMRIG